MSRIWSFGSWAIVIALAVYLFRSVSPNIDLDNTLGSAPDFALDDLDGQTFQLSDHRGNVVVLNFWATWCPPCRLEMPSFVSLQEEMKDEGVQFIGASLDEEGPAVVRPYAEKVGVNYPIVMADGSLVRSYGGVSAVPTTLLIDRQGHVRYRHEGYLTKGALKKALRSLIAEGDSPRSVGSGTAADATMTPAADEVTPKQLLDRVDRGDAVLIDVRTDAEYAAGRLKGSQQIDFLAPDFGRRVASLDRDQTYYLYCRTGNRSGQAVEAMRRMGFQNLHNLGGYADLLRSGFIPEQSIE
ncbi:MAG: redoxin domain-containing protein [Bacteroidota bacterium]